MHCFQANSQELSAQVVVNSDLVNQTNQQIFKTLERSLNEFINTQECLPPELLTLLGFLHLVARAHGTVESSLEHWVGVLRLK
mgnify:CR=1 FL=1